MTTRKAFTVTIRIVTIALLVGCEVASPDRPGSSTTNSPVVIERGMDPVLAIVLIVAAGVAGWYLRGKMQASDD